MKIVTKEHFGNLKRVFKEEGLVRTLDYDLDVTRARHRLLNGILANGTVYQNRTSFTRSKITHYDHDGLLERLRLNPNFPEEYQNPKWDYVL